MTWRREWGRPPRIFLYGEWLYRGTAGVAIVGAGIVACYAALAAPPDESHSLWSEWFFRIGVGLLGIGIVTVGYRAFLRQVWRTQLYFTSFDLNKKVQAEFDEAWDSDGRLSPPPGMGVNAEIGSPQF